jgi:TnpA family transposase
LILRKLGSYPRQNSLALALREIGRIERTLFMLAWLEDPALRRRVTAGSTKGKPGTRWHERYSSTGSEKVVTVPLKTSATGQAG